MVMVEDRYIAAALHEEPKVYVLRDWSIVMPQNPYKAPEMVMPHLCGRCPQRAVELGHAPNDFLTSSGVRSWNPETKVAVTTTGTHYRLDGQPDADYVRWCMENGFDPFKLLR